MSIAWLYLVQRVQAVLPLNPTGARAVPPELAFNTAVSFITNTNWQNYSGEIAMTHLTQAVGLAVQNFVSAAVGIAIAVALIRGIVRRRADTIGNFWADVTRSTLYVLLPIAFVGAIVLVWQGSPDLRRPYDRDHPAGAQQTIDLGPIASQEVIKELAPTAAASSTPTRRTPSRTRPPSPTGSSSS